MTYEVEMNFKNKASFSAQVEANCSEVAKVEAVRLARLQGFTYKVNGKVIVRIV